MSDDNALSPIEMRKNGMSGRLEFQLRNTVGDVSVSLPLIRRFAAESGLAGRQEYVLILSYEELATNIVKYGFDDAAIHRIRVLLENHSRGVSLTLMDDGHEFDPCRAPVPEFSPDPASGAPGGAGLRLVRKMARSMHYSRENGWNVVKVLI